MELNRRVSGEGFWTILAGLIVILALCRWAGCDFRSRPYEALERLQPLIDDRAKEMERNAP